MIIHHHLGLGDHFVCNGLVNYIAQKDNINIDLICKKHNFETVQYLYSENTTIKVIPIECYNEIIEVDKYARDTDQKVLRVGFEYCHGHNWDRSFYSQLDIDFVERYRFFKLPCKKPSQLLPVPEYPYILINNQSSESTYSIKTETQFNKIYIEKIEGYHLLSYIDLIYNAREIHAIDSAFFHLVDSIPMLTNQLYFHDIRKSITTFNKSIKWRTILYD